MSHYARANARSGDCCRRPHIRQGGDRDVAEKPRHLPQGKVDSKIVPVVELSYIHIILYVYVHLIQQQYEYIVCIISM